MSTPEPAQLIELVGLAGTGKSTLVRELCVHPSIERGIDYQTETAAQHLAHAPYTLKNLIRLAPSLARMGAALTDLSREDIKKMIYLSGWHQVFKQQRQNTHCVLSDQGPVFCLATLYEFGPGALRRKQLSGWWTHTFDVWAQHIDGVIWLKCPLDVLIGRIDGKQSHAIKGKEKTIAYEFLNRYHAAFEQVLAELSARRVIEIIEVETHRNTEDEVVAQLSTRLKQPRPACTPNT